MKKTKQLIAIISLTISIVGNAQTNTFPSFGNTGIGLLYPQTLLHLKAPVPTIRMDGAGGANATIGNINFQLTEGYDVANIKALQSGPSYGYQSALTFFTKNVAEEGVLERMRIDYNGNIGIGTLSPEALLHLKSPMPMFRLEGQGGLNATVGDINFRLIDGYDFANIKAVQSGPSYGYQSALTFFTRTSFEEGVVERMRINYDGNIGIGTAVPLEKLSVVGNAHINGNITAKKVKVTQSGWPDYVFYPSYELKPLSEIAQFIKQNQHLPDVPSVKEVEENGISLGDNQALLLKKIEELTLYLIEMKNENNSIKDYIQQLESRLKK